jgi:hypothetical protein
LCHWIMISWAPTSAELVFCWDKSAISIPLCPINVHHVRSLLLVLFEFVFVFVYPYRQKNDCPISLSLCKIIALATFGCRHSFKTADYCSTTSCIFLFTDGRMEDPFLKIRRKVCGEWLVPPPVVAGNLNTFLHRICSTQLTICCQLALSFRWYAMLMLVLLESTTRFWQDVAEGRRRTDVSLLQLVHSPKAHAWGSWLL